MRGPTDTEQTVCEFITLGWVDIPGSDRGDFRRRRVVDTSFVVATTVFSDSRMVRWQGKSDKSNALMHGTTYSISKYLSVNENCLCRCLLSFTDIGCNAHHITSIKGLVCPFLCHKNGSRVTDWYNWLSSCCPCLWCWVEIINLWLYKSRLNTLCSSRQS